MSSRELAVASFLRDRGMHFSERPSFVAEKAAVLEGFVEHCPFFGRKGSSELMISAMQ